MEKRISVVIPNYNKSDTIVHCLDAAFASDYKNFEVVVVDDCSEDNSVEVLRQYPCKIICLEKRSGTSAARNTGAANSTGDIIFFTDADCLLQKDSLSLLNSAISGNGQDTVIGGTYTKLPSEIEFFGLFQSLFINYSETKHIDKPDYIAAHAMGISAEDFKKSGGFPEDFMPIIEDVEFSHRLRRAGYNLVMNPDIKVQHIFNFTFVKSLKNAFRKTKYWCLYSLKNRDIFADSGTASIELKTNVVSFTLCVLLIVLWTVTQNQSLLYFLLPLFFANLYISRHLIKEFYRVRGTCFAVLASAYYTLVYPLPVGLGTVSALSVYVLRK